MNRLIGSRVGRSAIGGWLPGCCFFLLVGALTLPFFLVISFLVLPCVKKIREYFFSVPFFLFATLVDSRGIDASGCPDPVAPRREVFPGIQSDTARRLIVAGPEQSIESSSTGGGGGRRKKRNRNEKKNTTEKERQKKIKRESVWLWFFLSVLHLCYMYIYIKNSERETLPFPLMTSLIETRTTPSSTRKRPKRRRYRVLLYRVIPCRLPHSEPICARKTETRNQNKKERKKRDEERLEVVDRPIGMSSLAKILRFRPFLWTVAERGGGCKVKRNRWDVVLQPQEFDLTSAPFQVLLLLLKKWNFFAVQFRRNALN